MAVILTHKMASAKIANRILIADKVKIVDIDFHDELIAKEGLPMYATRSLSNTKTERCIESRAVILPLCCFPAPNMFHRVFREPKI